MWVKRPRHRHSLVAGIDAAARKDELSGHEFVPCVPLAQQYFRPRSRTIDQDEGCCVLWHHVGSGQIAIDLVHPLHEAVHALDCIGMIRRHAVHHSSYASRCRVLLSGMSGVRAVHGRGWSDVLRRQPQIVTRRRPARPQPGARSPDRPAESFRRCDRQSGHGDFHGGGNVDLPRSRRKEGPEEDDVVS